MKCPRCVQRIHRTAESCPHCGFSLEEADRLFGADGLVVRRLTDAAGLLRRPDRERVAQVLDRFARCFPQLFFAVYTGAFTELTSLRQFGFWLLNRAAFEDIGVEQPNEAAVVLVIDAESKSASLSFGYLLDPFLDEGDTFRCLSKAHPHFLEGDYRRGIVALAATLHKVLRRRSRQARRDPERFERRVRPPQEVGDLVRRIRSGHKAARRVKQEVPR
jgi:uncharacterized membrane protein YgcG